MKQYFKLLKMIGKFSTDSQYRNKVLRVINYHVNTEVLQTSNIKEETEFEQFKTLKFYLIGGCELTFIKEQLNHFGAKTKHTFDEGASSTPLAECENPNSSLWYFKPDIIIMSNIQIFRGIVQKNQLKTIEYKYEDQVKDMEMAISEYRLAIKKIQNKLNSKTFIISYPLKYRPTFGLHEYKSFKTNLSLIELIKSYELKLYELCKETVNTFLLDVNLTLESNGKLSTIRDTDADGIYEHFTKEGAFEIVKNIDAQLGLLNKSIRRVKCAVFDLDNTMWSGILREDGVSGVEVRENVLNIMKILASRGIMLALCSKNDPEEVKYLEELLGKDLYNLITITKINWNPKSQNLKAISQQLNIGLDNLALFDDSEFERNEVKTNVPEVMVFDDSKILKCLHMPEFIPYGEFNKDSITRVKKYKEQALRSTAEQSFLDDHHSYEEFLKSSNLTLEIRKPKEGEISRAVELLQRTNQLNATLKRTDLNDLVTYHKNTKQFLILSAFLKDKFGDYGMIGVCIVEKSNKYWKILEIAFSCRAMGRKIEHALLLDVIKQAFKNKVSSLSLEVTITDRNKQIMEILGEMGFQKTKGMGSNENQVLQQNLDSPPPNLSHYASWLNLSS